MLTIVRPGRDKALLVASVVLWACSKPESSGLFGPAQPLDRSVENSSLENNGTASITDTGSVPSAGVASEESGAIEEGPPPVDLSESVAPDLAGGEQAMQPPLVTPEAGAPPSTNDELGADAGIEGPQPPPSSPAPECAGQPLGGVCWYLAGDLEPCADFCAAHGGFSDTSLAIIGTPGQGGSLEGCASVLQALEVEAGAGVTSGYREDGLGLGCHVLIDAAGAVTSAWWLTAPDFSPAALGAQVRLACGCAR
jgi:hypothetical protein